MANGVGPVVADGDGYEAVPRGQWRWFVPRWSNFWTWGVSFRWKCGGTDERVTCPHGSDSVLVYHAVNSRQITWHCRD